MAIEDRGPELAAVCWTFVTTAFVATALRCYVRTRIVKRFGLDDWTMLAALVSITHSHMESSGFKTSQTNVVPHTRFPSSSSSRVPCAASTTAQADISGI